MTNADLSALTVDQLAPEPRSGLLRRLLAPFAVTSPGVFLYHPGQRQVLPRLRA